MTLRPILRPSTRKPSSPGGVDVGVQASMSTEEAGSMLSTLWKLITQPFRRSS